MIKNLFSPPIAQALDQDLKINTFTKIQNMAVPIIMEGHDLLAVSETGSGKTLAYVLPLVQKILNFQKRPTKILVITPTKELSEQILAVFKIICRHTSLISMSLYGGVNFNAQVKALKNGVHIIVACPGRLKDHIEKQTINLSGIDYLVLDEFDQLMDMGFLPDLKMALAETKNKKQTLLFSATINLEIESFINEIIPNAKRVLLAKNSPKKTINELFCPINDELKYPFLRFLIKHKKIKSCLIFTNTKEDAINLGDKFIADHYAAVILIGDMTNHQRKKALDAIKQKKACIMIATDVASRGIDLPHVTHIFNFNPPLNLESYIHRTGRTARHDLLGEAITLYSMDETDLLMKIFNDLMPTAFKFKEFDYQLKVKRKKT